MPNRARNCAPPLHAVTRRCRPSTRSRIGRGGGGDPGRGRAVLPRLPAQEPRCSPEREQPRAPTPPDGSRVQAQPAAALRWPRGRAQAHGAPPLQPRPSACLHARPAGHAQLGFRRPGDRDSRSWVFIFSAVGDMLLKLGSRCLRLVTAKAVCVEPHPSRQDGDFSLCVSTCSTMERICSCEKV